MKTKILLLGLVLSAGTAGGALADGGDPGKHGGQPPQAGSSSGKDNGEHSGAKGDKDGKPDKPKPERGFKDELRTLGLSCSSKAIDLKGTIVSVGEGSLSLSVRHANRHGSGLIGTQVSVLLISSTDIKRKGPATAADLVAGDAVKVHALACAKGAAAGATPSSAATAAVLVARKVIAKPAADAQPVSG